MTLGAAQMMLQSVFDEIISVQNMEIERRPYHKNCSCELHKLKHGHSRSFPQPSMIAFTKRQSWSDCSLSTKVTKIFDLQRENSMGNEDKNKAGSYNHR